MIKLNDIKTPISEHLINYENTLNITLNTNVALLNKIIDYLFQEKGKQIRPMYVILSAGTIGNINLQTYRAAVMLEILHTASLIHDDVVDESDERRGKESINYKWQNKIAVLTGDFLISKALKYGIDNNDDKLIPIVIKTACDMSKGELIQIEQTMSLDITEEVYLDIIFKKTASLIAACCSAGAISVNADDNTIEKMHDLGKNIGMAFQIKDDVLDFEYHADTKKPKAKDIKEKKITLPLLRALKNVDKAQKNEIINIIKNHNNDSNKITEVIDFINKNNGVEYAKSRIEDYQNKALNSLKEFDNNKYSKLFKQLISYNTTRNC